MQEILVTLGGAVIKSVFFYLLVDGSCLFFVVCIILCVVFQCFLFAVHDISQCYFAVNVVHILDVPWLFQQISDC